MKRTAICAVDDKGEVQMRTEVVTDPGNCGGPQSVPATAAARGSWSRIAVALAAA
jgi:hypothetical protein